jgi:hypothetical protein
MIADITVIRVTEKINLIITLDAYSSLNFSKCLHLWQVLSNVSVVKG